MFLLTFITKLVAAVCGGVVVVVVVVAAAAAAAAAGIAICSSPFHVPISRMQSQMSCI